MGIKENDIIGLTRDIDENLSKGLVGLVLQCRGNSFDVKFPIQGHDDLYARVAPEDIKLLIGSPLNNQS